MEPNTNKLWLYEPALFTFRKIKIDENLFMVKATNSEGCTITFDRTEIDKKAENQNFEVLIESQDFIDACDTKVNKD